MPHSYAVIHFAQTRAIGGRLLRNLRGNLVAEIAENGSCIDRSGPAATDPTSLLAGVLPCSPSAASLMSRKD